MASIKLVKNKNGVSYQITVSHGRDAKNKQIRHFITWTPPEGMTQRKIEKELQHVAIEFEDRVKAGLAQDDGIKFSGFADKWFNEYATKQLKIKTRVEYKKRFTRINAAIGHIKLCDLKTGHLNAFYANLQEEGIKSNLATATANKRLRETMKERKLSGVAVGKTSGLAPSTVNIAARGVPVALATAQAIAKAMDIKLNEYFTVHDDPDVLSASTVRCYHRIISSVLTKAVKWGYIQYNPALNAELPKMSQHEASYLDETSAKRLLQVLQNEPIKYRTMITFDLLSGLRRGELLGLRWCDVDFDMKVITIRQTSAYAAGKGMYIDTPKTSTSSRPLRLSESAFVLLRLYKAWQDEQKEKCGSKWQNKDDRIFTSDEGAPLFPDTLTKWFSKFIKDNGFQKVTVHSLRHTYASLMIANGTPLVVVSKRLGHSQTSTTANIYSHLIQSADEKAAQVVEVFNDIVIPGTASELKKAN